MVQLLSEFFTSYAKLEAGVDSPVDVNVPALVFGQMIGVTTQAGILRVVVPAM